MVMMGKLKPSDQEFPQSLRHIPQPPTQLYIGGDLTPLQDKPAVSVIGSRAVTPYGKQVTARLVGELAKQGIAIISGLALGIDGLAHQAALGANGYTIAVLPCGLDRIYPRSHHQLAERIMKQGGAIVSEYPPGTEPYKTNFIERNRLVSGLSQATLIIEAAERSGTLHTANFALEQGRMVLAVPGNITSEASTGTNNLIKTGAVPVTDVQDVLHALGIKQQLRLVTVAAANAEEAIILKLLQEGIQDVNELQSESGLPPDLFNQTLTMLEISAKIRPLGGGHWGVS